MKKATFLLAAAAIAAVSLGVRAEEPAPDEMAPDFSAAPRPNDVAVVIGIEKYRDLPKSDYSASDAKLMHDYLVALGYPSRNVELLTDDHATAIDIKKAIEKWLPNQVKKDSKVFVYYSGHGSPDAASGDAYMVPYDGDPNYLSDTAYSLKRLYGQLGKLQAAEVVVALDSCFSGASSNGQGRTVLGAGQRPLVMSMQMDKAALSPNIAIITATQGTQISSSSPDKKHGIFTYEFLKAIRDGAKGLGEIYEKIKPRVEDEAKQLNISQSPSLMPEPEKIAGRFQFAAFTKMEPPKEVKDKELEKKLAAEEAKLEEKMRQLQEKQEKMDQEMRDRQAQLEKQAQDKAAQLESNARDKVLEEQRRVAAERERAEREARYERDRLEQRAREIEQQRKSNEEPAFIPPTF